MDIKCQASMTSSNPTTLICSYDLTTLSNYPSCLNRISLDPCRQADMASFHLHYFKSASQIPRQSTWFGEETPHPPPVGFVSLFMDSVELSYDERE